MFVDFFIKRPVFATVCALLTIIGGAIAIPTLPIAQYPQLAAPQVTISAFYTGASAEVVESAVTMPIEQIVNGVEGMEYVQSSSGSNGVSTVTITFDVERDIDLAAVDVQNRVSQALGRLPNEVKQTGVSVTKSAGGFVLAAGMYSEHGEYTNAFISNYIDVYLKDALKRVKGVGDVIIFGERKYAMRLWLDPVRMAARKLTATDVVNALREQNIQIAAGQVGLEPAPVGQTVQLTVSAVGRLPDADAFGRIILKTAEDGTLVLLKDVGRTEIGAEDYSTALRYNGHEAIGFGIEQLSNANALDVDHDVLVAIAELEKSFPPGLKLQVAFDPTTAVRDSITEVLTTLLEAIILVILVIFIFLQSWRSTIIPAITIPVSLIGTFIFIKAFGFSINTLTLFGLTLATGLVVDDAIVVIENIERHIAERRQGAHRAASSAMSEVAGAVIATSLVLIAVFVPVALFPGTTGRIYKQFSLTIAFSIALSAFNALTLTPALAAVLLRHSDKPKLFFFRGVNRAIDWLTGGYRSLLAFLLNHKAIMSVVFVAGLAATVWIYGKVPTSFVPDEDQGFLIVFVQGPPGASLQNTQGVTEQVEGILKQQPEITGVFNVNGFSFTGASSNNATLFIAFKPNSERKGAEHSVMAVMNRVRGPLFMIPGAFVIPFLPPSIQGVGFFGGFQFELEDRTGGPIDNLGAMTYAIMGAAAQNHDLAGVFGAFTTNNPKLVVEIDREKAKSLGIPFSQITDTLGVYMGSAYVNDFDFNNRSYRVYAQADSQFRSSPKDIAQFYVRSDKGQMIPLDAVTRVINSTAPQTITHFNLFRSSEINGSAAPGVSSGVALASMEAVARQVLPPGFSYEWSGIAVEQLQSGSQGLFIFFLGVLVVYLVLAAQYESFALPLIIMLAVPLAILGALLMQWARGLSNDVFCQIGLVMLVGLATKNAILIVEFAEQLRQKGMTIAEAALESARIRFRPILMTSLAFILGVLPLVFASGAGANSRHSLGTAVFGGMVFSTALNLLFIPVLYVLIETLRERKGKHPTREHDIITAPIAPLPAEESHA